MTFLIAIGGHTGTGKTTLAYGLKKRSPHLRDSVIIEDDQVRRKLLGVDLKHILKDADYSDDVSSRVVNEIAQETNDAVGRGISVINSSGFFSETSRASIQQLAESDDVTFIGIWLITSHATMKSRIAKRLKERQNMHELSLEMGHASDADEGVIDKYGDIGAPKSPEWQTLDAGCSEEHLLTQSLQLIEKHS